jgi:hypothetical protein
MVAKAWALASPRFWDVNSRREHGRADDFNFTDKFARNRVFIGNSDLRSVIPLVVVSG